MKRINRIAGIIVLSIALVFLLLLILTPPIAKNYINKNGAELVGRNLNVEKFKLNYFTSTVKVIDFKLFEENGSDVFVAFDTLLLDIKPLRLLKHEVYVEQFQMVNPSVHITQNDTVFNFSDLMDFYSSEDSTSEEETEAESYRLNLNRLELKRGGFRYHDIEMEHGLTAHDLSFSIPHIYWGGQEKSKAAVKFKLGRGGEFISSFHYDTENGDFEGDVDITGMALEIVLPYIQEYMKFSDIDGTVSGNIMFSGNVHEMELLSLNGTMNVDSVIIKDMQDKTVLGVENGKAVLKEFKPILYQVEINSIELNSPYVYFALIDSLSNFEKMLVEQTTYSENESLEPETEMQMVLNRFIINKGLVDFSDQRLYKIFDYELSEIKAEMDTISLQDDWITLNAEMKLNKRGKLTGSLGVNPQAPLDKVSVEYVIRDFQLPDVNIYSKHYTGLPILFGDMYYVGNTTITNKQLESNNEIIIRNVEMGRKAGGLYNLPIKLALFILKDINGDISMNIPVRGDLNDPQMKIGTIIWDTFKGFMFKVVASPFKALGSLVGAKPTEMEEITMSYSDTTLVKKQQRNLDILLELEELKPELKIELQYLNDKKLERSDVAAQLLQDSFYKKYNKKAGNHRKAYLSFLKETSGKDSLVIQDYELMLAQPEVVDSIIQAKEDMRLNLVEDYLITKNDSTTIEILDYNSSEALNVGSRPHFNIKYVLAEDENDETKKSGN